MKIIFDNIIFSLQKSGGISTLIYEILKKYFPLSANKNIYFLDYKENENNIYRKTFEIPSDKILNQRKEPVKILRYLNPKIANLETEKFIFVSSYYRYCKNKTAINVVIVYDFTYEFFGKGLAKTVHSYQKKKAILNASYIICISENTKKDLISIIPQVNKEKIKVLHIGASPDYYAITSDYNLGEINEDLDKLKNKKIVIFVGGRAPYKNFDKAAEAFSLLDDSYHFVIVGPPLTENEENYLSALLLKTNFTVLNGISNNNLNMIYNKAWVLLYPSEYEGFGIPVVEAMNTGLPVIAYNKSSIPEVAGDAGILLNNLSPQSIKDAILKLNNNDYRNEIIEKGFEQAKKFTWDKTIENYISYFEEVSKT
ncbi:glycosyltransferase family 4 protein [Chryseobacterium sp. C-71]|uniref:glycosyltransferase family 4 protein n=1 Tax=Chryseobacterium sp. C-71 TaxID=2893882 RepID=UPI001E5495FA|nr:glycosyltransferase family 1 protein [Chryseobacterium sp. C-71]UFH33332.1 glycosyltransferase family 4 protein [Chryseobacterium sp. C-71]